VFGLPDMVGVPVAKDALPLHRSVLCLATGQYSSCTVALSTAHPGGPTALVLRSGTGEPQMGEVKSCRGALLVGTTPAEIALER
jgi:hypothetical protein